jgi:hypothetical protein
MTRRLHLIQFTGPASAVYETSQLPDHRLLDYGDPSIARAAGRSLCRRRGRIRRETDSHC